jgi:hypothetical protein
LEVSREQFLHHAQQTLEIMFGFFFIRSAGLLSGSLGDAAGCGLLGRLFGSGLCAALGLVAAGGFLDAALAFFAGLSSVPASPSSDFAGSYAFAFFLQYVSALC